jgi:hypothetical protein
MKASHIEVIRQTKGREERCKREDILPPDHNEL